MPWYFLLLTTSSLAETHGEFHSGATTAWRKAMVMMVLIRWLPVPTKPML